MALNKFDTEDNHMNDFNIYRNLVAGISPKEFELFCLEVLQSFAHEEGLSNCRFEYDKKLVTHDSTYQIDIYFEFEMLGMTYKTLCECKRHGRNVERDELVALKGKLESGGCHKGIIMSTSGFQKDALRYADAHGIALWQIVDAVVKRIKCSAPQSFNMADYMAFEMSKRLPDFYVSEWNCEYDCPMKEIYPTETMNTEAFNATKALLR